MKNIKKNVVILSSDLIYGGAQGVIFKLCRELSKEFNLYLILFSGEVDYPYSGKRINLNLKSSNNWLTRIYRFFFRIYKVRKIKRGFNIDITFSFGDGENFVNILSRNKDKVIVCIQNYTLITTKGKLHSLSAKLLYNHSDKIIAVSKMARKDLIDNFKVNANKIEVIYNPIDIEGIVSLSEEEVDSKYKGIFNNPVFINVGRLIKQKGQWHLIRAFSLVKKEIKDAKLVILGRGELENYLKELAKDLGLENDIVFLGFQQNPFKFVAQSCIFVLSSLFEGFPLVLAESMACGTPIVSCDCLSGPREILAPGTDFSLQAKDIEYGNFGVLVPVCDGKMYTARDPITREERLLAKAMIDLYRDKEKRSLYSKMGKSRARNFELKKQLKQYNNLTDG